MADESVNSPEPQGVSPDPINPPVADPPPADFQQVEVEHMDSDERQHRFGTPQTGGVHVFYSSQTSAAFGLLKPPVAATWICLAIAWFFLGSKVPFTVFLGIPFDLAALILAAVSLSRGGVFTGVSVMLLGTVGSLIVYLVGLFRFLAVA